MAQHVADTDLRCETRVEVELEGQGRTMTKPIRVLVADDHAIVRRGIRALLAEVPDVEVVGEAGDGLEAAVRAATLRPDIILMDLMTPSPVEIEVMRQIKARQPHIHILALTSFAAGDKASPAIRTGALVYLLKDSGPEGLLQAIRQIHHD